MDKKPWIIDSLLQTIIIVLLCAVLVAANRFTAVQEREQKHRLRADAILDQVDPHALSASHPVEIDPEEIAAAFRSLRQDMIRTTFANYAGSEEQSQDNAIARLYLGLALADRCERQIKDRGKP